MMNLGKHFSWQNWVIMTCILTGAFTFWPMSAAQAGALTMEVDRNVVPVGETFILQVVYTEKVSSQSPEPSSQLDPSFKVLSGPSVQSSTTIINGKISTETSWAWEIQVTQPGEFTIPRFTLGGQRTTLIRMDVVAKNTAGQPQFEDIIVSLEANKETALVGEQIILSYKILSRTRYRATEQPKVVQLPSSFDEQVLEPHSGEKYVSTVNSQPYQVVEYRQAIYASEAGTYTLEPFVLRGRYRSTTSSNRRNQIFEIKSEQITLTINPLDTSSMTSKKHQQTKIPVTDQLQLSAQWAIPDGPIDIGEPIILEVHMSAPAQMTNRLPDIELPSSSALKIYSDGEESRQDMNWERGITGYRTQRFAIIPQKSGTLTIPSTQIAWWNTEKNKMQFTEIAGQEIQVTDGQSSQNQAKPGSNNDIELGLNEDNDFEAELLLDQTNNAPNSDITSAKTRLEEQAHAETEFWRNTSLFMGVVWLFTAGYLLQTRYNPSFQQASNKNKPANKADEQSAPQTLSTPGSHPIGQAQTLSPEQKEANRLFRRKAQLDMVPILELHPHDVPPRAACLQLMQALCNWASQESGHSPKNVTQLLECIQANDPWQPLLQECEAFLYNPALGNSTDAATWPKEAIRKTLVKGLPNLKPTGSKLNKENQSLAPLIP